MLLKKWMITKGFYQDTLLLTSVMFLGSTGLGRTCCCLGMKLQYRLQCKRYVQDTSTVDRKLVHQSVATWQAALAL